jgi:hypothetical protein
VFEGLKLTRPEIGAMILALGPIQVALFQWWRTHRRPDNFTLAPSRWRWSANCSSSPPAISRA